MQPRGLKPKSPETVQKRILKLGKRIENKYRWRDGGIERYGKIVTEGRQKLHNELVKLLLRDKVLTAIMTSPKLVGKKRRIENIANYAMQKSGFDKQRAIQFLTSMQDRLMKAFPSENRKPLQRQIMGVAIKKKLSKERASIYSENVYHSIGTEADLIYIDLKWAKMSLQHPERLAEIWKTK